MKHIARIIILVFLLVQSSACNLRSIFRRSKPAANMQITNSEEVSIVDATIMDRSPDGRWLVVYTYPNPPESHFCIYDSKELEPVFCMPEQDEMGISLQPVSWSPDSKKLAFVERMPNIPVDTDIWILDIESARMVDITEDNVSGILSADMTGVPFMDHAPTWSPDGVWIAFSRTTFNNEALRYETALYKIPAQGGEAEKIQKVSEEPAAIPDGMLAWLADGRLIYTPRGQQLNGGALGLHAVDGAGEQPPQALERPGQETVLSNLLSVSSDSAYALVVHEIITNVKAEYTLIQLINLETGKSTPLKPLQPNEIPFWFKRSNWATFSPDSSKIAYFYESQTPTPQWRLALIDIGGDSEVILKTFDSKKYYVNYPFRWGQDDTMMIRLVEEDPPFPIQLLTVK